MQTILMTPAEHDDRTIITTIVHLPDGSTCEMRWPNPPFQRITTRNKRGNYANIQGMTNKFRGI